MYRGTRETALSAPKDATLQWSHEKCEYKRTKETLWIPRISNGRVPAQGKWAAVAAVAAGATLGRGLGRPMDSERAPPSIKGLSADNVATADQATDSRPGCTVRVRQGVWAGRYALRLLTTASSRKNYKSPYPGYGFLCAFATIRAPS